MQLQSHIKHTAKNAGAFAVAFFRWLALGVAVGGLCGVTGALFARSVSLVTALRAEHGWLLYLLPVGGLLSVAVYKLCRVIGVGTNDVLESVRTQKPLSFLLAPAVFIGAVLTHLCGGSAGREGAALQLGGSVSALLARVLRLNERARHILTLCGMGALFSAVFGTPLGACVFALEVVSVGQICSAALFPVLIASLTAYGVAGLCGAVPERFVLAAVPAVELNVLWRVAVIAAVAAVVSALFCHLLHFSEKAFETYIKNPFIRIFVGGVAIVLLTVLLGTADYNGGGTEVIGRIFAGGTVRPEAFLLKIVFTAITIGAGFKGGEIVPSLFIGATLGAVLAGLLGLDPAFGAAVGMAALFCGVTNCPFAACFLCAELFGAQGLLFFAFAAVISFVLSGYAGLYTGQRLLFSKLSEERLDTNVG